MSPAVRAVSATAHFGMPTPAVAVAIGQIRGLEAVGRNRAFSGEGKLAVAPAGRRPTNCLFLVALGLVNLRSATRPESSRVGGISRFVRLHLRSLCSHDARDLAYADHLNRATMLSKVSGFL